jgi:hypothetical protein
MDNIEKIDKFKEEFIYIKNQQIKALAMAAVGTLPDYFFEIPASSTGKYHPGYSLGDGGLYRHTRAAIRIAIELFRLDWWHFTSDEQDLIIASLLVHDGWKSGWPKEQYTRSDHPRIAFDTLNKNEDLHNFVSQEQFNMFLNNIISHMGQWNYDSKTQQEILPKPQTKFQKFVHLADYLASRKCLEMNFVMPLSRN